MRGLQTIEAHRLRAGMTIAYQGREIRLDTIFFCPNDIPTEVRATAEYGRTRITFMADEIVAVGGWV